MSLYLVRNLDFIQSSFSFTDMPVAYMYSSILVVFFSKQALIENSRKNLPDREKLAVETLGNFVLISGLVILCPTTVQGCPFL